jgi:hypothetical protein
VVSHEIRADESREYAYFVRDDVMLFLDIDGTLSPVDDLTAWHDYTPVRTYPDPRMQVSPELMKRIAALDTDMVILSSWQELGAEIFSPWLDRRLEALSLESSERGNVKARVLHAYLMQHPEIRAVVWADDMLVQYGVPKYLRHHVKESGIAFLVVRPVDGIAPDDLAAIEDFVNHPEHRIPAKISYGPDNLEAYEAAISRMHRADRWAEHPEDESWDAR